MTIIRKLLTARLAVVCTKAIARLNSSTSNYVNEKSKSTDKEPESKPDNNANVADKLDESEYEHVNPETGERGGPRGPEPTRFGDWERKGRVSDF